MLGSSVGIQFARSVVEGPESYKRAMLFIANNNEPFRISEIPELPEESKVVLAQRLIRDGLLACTGESPD
jgi:hypothetical protein